MNLKNQQTSFYSSSSRKKSLKLKLLKFDFAGKNSCNTTKKTPVVLPWMRAPTPFIINAIIITQLGVYVCTCLYDVCNVSLIFLKRQTKKEEKSFTLFFFSSFSKLIKKSVSFLRKRKRKINHALWKTNRDSKKKKKKKKILRKWKWRRYRCGNGAGKTRTRYV